MIYIWIAWTTDGHYLGGQTQDYYALHDWLTGRILEGDIYGYRVKCI